MSNTNNSTPTNTVKTLSDLLGRLCEIYDSKIDPYVVRHRRNHEDYLEFCAGYIMVIDYLKDYIKKYYAGNKVVIGDIPGREESNPNVVSAPPGEIMLYLLYRIREHERFILKIENALYTEMYSKETSLFSQEDIKNGELKIKSLRELMRGLSFALKDVQLLLTGLTREPIG